MKTIIINLSIAICFSFFHCNEEKDKQSSIVVRPHPDVTVNFTKGFGGQVVFLSYVFSSTNGDELNFIAFTSDPSVATVKHRTGQYIRDY